MSASGGTCVLPASRFEGNAGDGADGADGADGDGSEPLRQAGAKTAIADASTAAVTARRIIPFRTLLASRTISCSM
jgi:hypothetical protein